MDVHDEARTKTDGHPPVRKQIASPARRCARCQRCRHRARDPVVSGTFQQDVRKPVRLLLGNAIGVIRANGRATGWNDPPLCYDAGCTSCLAPHPDGVRAGVHPQPRPRRASVPIALATRATGRSGRRALRRISRDGGASWACRRVACKEHAFALVARRSRRWTPPADHARSCHLSHLGCRDSCDWARRELHAQLVLLRRTAVCGGRMQSQNLAADPAIGRAAVRGAGAGRR